MGWISHIHFFRLAVPDRIQTEERSPAWAQKSGEFVQYRVHERVRNVLKDLSGVQQTDASRFRRNLGNRTCYKFVIRKFEMPRAQGDHVIRQINAKDTIDRSVSP